MQLLKRIAVMAFGVGLFSALLGQQAGGRGPGQIVVLVPMPVTENPWLPPNKPISRLSELLAKHTGQPNWTETLVSDHLFHGDYISMGPGQKTPRRLHQDNRVWWIVQDGQIRFTIEGQEPFIAGKGFMVQVPHRLVYSMETVGDKPSLRFEVTIPHSHTMYPADETPAPEAGVKFMRAAVANIKGSYDRASVPYIDFNEIAAGRAKPKQNQNQFIGDPHGIANIIRGDARKQPPAREGDKGHLHLTGPEFWFILEGQMEFKIGSVPTFVADQGDIVYAPEQTWHRIRFAGAGMATRLAIVGYANSHVFQPPEETSGPDPAQQ
jgi:mannose-6-phosphate isomerase-like protein (cupin superfamily)